MPDLGEHLDVVPLVTDREDRPERHPEPPREPAHRATFRDPRRDELDEMRVADHDLGPAGEQGTREWRDHRRERRLTGAHHLGDRMTDGRDQVVFEPWTGPHERGVFIGAWIVRADDEPLEVVEMRIESLGTRPDDDLARDLGRQRGVHEEAARPLGAPRRHLADEGSLVADDRGVELQLEREAHRARHHAARDQADEDASSARGTNGGPRIRADRQVVADDGAVDVEGDEADGQDRVPAT